jgi:hypothetical protein
MSFNKELAPKPVLYKRQICRLLHIPYKPHYKCYIKRKYSCLTWREKREIRDYILDTVPTSSRYRHYSMSQWELIHYLVKHFIEVNPVNIAEKTINNKLNYSDSQIYFKFKDEVLKELVLN